MWGLLDNLKTADEDDETCDHDWEETGRTRRTSGGGPFERSFGWTFDRDGDGQPVIALYIRDEMRDQCVHCGDEQWRTYQRQTAKWYPSKIEDGHMDGKFKILGEDRR